MYGRHPAPAIGPRIIFSKVPSLLLGNHARASATPLPWSIETTFVVAAAHHDSVTQAFTLEQMHQGKSLRAGEV